MIQKHNTKLHPKKMLGIFNRGQKILNLLLMSGECDPFVFVFQTREVWMMQMILPMIHGARTMTPTNCGVSVENHMITGQH